MTGSEQIFQALSDLIPSYADKAKALGRREADWLFCAGGNVSEVELLQLYAKSSGLTVIEEDELPKEIPAWPDVSVAYLNYWCCLPLLGQEEDLTVLLCDPYAMEHHRCLFQSVWHREPKFALIRRSLLERLIVDVYRHPSEFAETDLDSEETLKSLASEAKIVRLVNEMFTQAAERRASDIHIEPEKSELVIRLRIDGVLHEYLRCPLTDYPAIASRIKLIGGLNIAESRVPQDGRTSFTLGRSEMDVRISTIPTMTGESLVLRLLKKDTVSFDLGNVGMAEPMQRDFEQLIRIPHGIILVVGPTGSGKSTTLYSVVSQLNDRKNKIITIEDPVEYQLEGLSQMQVSPKIGVTFASGLRAIVRQDPDIILVGEIRDRETADIAINAALTGHLVLSTLHTNDAAGAVSRLQDMGVESFLLASALYGVLSQRLVRKICRDCEGNGRDPRRNDGKCRGCGGTGFHGRTGIFELLLVDDDIRSAITARASSTKIAELAMQKGMRPILSDGMDKVAAGMTTEAEIRRSAAGI